MLKKMGFWILLAMTSLTACSSYFKRKDCEKVNWYNHGFQVAMSGKRLDADNLVKECTKVEAEVQHADLDTGFKAGMAKYCEPQTAFQMGRDGEPFDGSDLCTDGNLALLIERHAEGLKSYCSPQNGRAVGGAGKAYKKVCPPNLEPAFLSEYRKGRKVYLEALVVQKESEARQTDQNVSSLQMRLSVKTLEMAALPRSQRVERVSKYDPVLKKYVETTEVKEDAGIARRRDQIQWDIDGINRSIEAESRKKNQLLDEIRVLRTEIVSLSAASSASR